MLAKPIHQGSSIGMEIYFTTDAEIPYDPPVVKFQAVNPNGKVIPMAISEHPETGRFKAYTSSRSMHGPWTIECLGDDDGDVYDVVVWDVLPSSVLQMA